MADAGSLIADGAAMAAQYAGRYVRRNIFGSHSSRSSIKSRATPNGRPRAARLNRKETHYLDTALGTGGIAAVPVGGWVLCFNNIAEGVEYNTRNGRTIIGKYAQLDVCIYPPTTADAMDVVQWALVNDVSGVGTAPAYTDIFDEAATGVPLAQCFKNIRSNVDCFKIMAGDNVIVRNGLPNATYHVRRLIKIPLKYTRTNFKDNTAVIPLTNALYFVMVSQNNSGVVASSASALTVLRYAFVDI
jgi:hypothetical protein